MGRKVPMRRIVVTPNAIAAAEDKRKTPLAFMSRRTMSPREGLCEMIAFTRTPSATANKSEKSVAKRRGRPEPGCDVEAAHFAQAAFSASISAPHLAQVHITASCHFGDQWQSTGLESGLQPV